MTSKLIVFDFADTIATLQPAKEYLLQQFIYERTSSLIPLGHIADVYHYIGNILFYSSVGVRTGLARRTFYIQFNRTILELLGVAHLVTAEDFYEYFEQHKREWKVKKGVRELFAEIKNIGFNLSLVSNFDTRLHRVLEEMNIRAFFDSVFVSQEVGMEKPDELFLKMPLEIHQTKASNAYFVGDNYRLDFLPASKAGYKAILLDEHDRYPTLRAVEKVASLDEIRRLL